MKSVILLFTFFACSAMASEQVEVKSKIKNVVVYQQGAQVKREGGFTVKKGITELVISGISSEIDPNTLQINATGNLIILDSKRTIRYPEPVAENEKPIEIPLKIKNEITRIQDSLFDLSYDMAALQNKIDVLNSQKRIIENNGTIMGKGKVNDSIPLLRDALKFYQEEMNNINSALLKLNKEMTLLAKIQSRMNERLKELNNYQNTFLPQPQNFAPIHEIVVTVSANETTTGQLSVTYLVNGAGWIPLYDLRSTDKGNSIELTYKAQVYQNTGVDWENTRLNLSTNNPYANKTKPQLNPWYLDYYTQNVMYNNGYQDSKKDKSLRSEAATQPGSLYNGRERLAERDMEAMTADQFVTTVEQLVSVEYAIDLPYTIKSDNQKNMVLVKTSSLKTDYLYYSVPKLDPGVYLIAQITDLDELNLIPGNATIFHQGSYLGTTYISPNSLSDTMDLSLGKTDNITVKRQLIKNATKEKVVGDKIVKTFAYQIEIKNHNKLSIDLIVEDQIPVSRNPEIEIELMEQSKGKLDEVNGFVIWKNKLKPNELSKYELIYSVSYEKTKPINLASY